MNTKPERPEWADATMKMPVPPFLPPDKIGTDQWPNVAKTVPDFTAAVITLENGKQIPVPFSAMPKESLEKVKEQLLEEILHGPSDSGTAPIDGIKEKYLAWVESEGKKGGSSFYFDAFRAGYEEGRKADDVDIIFLKQNFRVALRQLREIRDYGYIKTKLTSNETGLEDRVDEFLNTFK